MNFVKGLQMSEYVYKLYQSSQIKCLGTLFLIVNCSHSAPVRAILHYVQTNAHIEEQLLLLTLLLCSTVSLLVRVEIR